MYTLYVHVFNYCLGHIHLYMFVKLAKGIIYADLLNKN